METKGCTLCHAETGGAETGGGDQSSGLDFPLTQDGTGEDDTHGVCRRTPPGPPGEESRVCDVCLQTRPAFEASPRLLPDPRRRRDPRWSS